MTRREALLAAAALAAAPRADAATTDFRAAGLAVRKDVTSAWDAYIAHAFGYDELQPVSRTAADFFAPGHTFGLTIVEALDTFALMRLDDQLKTGVSWVVDHLDPTVDALVNTFELTIRVVGGLLSAHLATGDARLLDRALEVAERLLPAFATPTGLPAGRVNLKTGALDDLEIGSAQGATHVAEFATLTALTGDRRFLDTSRRAIDALLTRRFATGLAGSTLDTRSGDWLDAQSDIAPPNDSFVESLWHGWQLTGDTYYRDAYGAVLAAILSHQLKRTARGVWILPVDADNGVSAGNEQSALSAFFPGLLAQSGHRATGAKLMRAWNGVLGHRRLLPEGFDAATGAVSDPRALLRPEFTDACLHLWLDTRDDRYRTWAARQAARERRLCAAGGALTVIDDITAPKPVQGDRLPGYWWSEQTKYCWLMFTKPRAVDLSKLVLSTEGNVLRGWRGR